MTSLTRAQLARLVDHTLLRPEATDQQVLDFAAEVEELGVWSVCVSPSRLPVTTELPVSAVCGFPSGAHPSEVKAAEAALAVRHGAAEIDMVMDLGLAASNDWRAVTADIDAVRRAVPDAVLKVIIESALWDDAGIVAACRAAQSAGADFVKTSTGFHPAGGASVAAVRLMRDTVGDALGVKASGGIRSAQAALAMVDAGATRLGLSGTKAVLDGLTQLPESGAIDG